MDPSLSVGDSEETMFKPIQVRKCGIATGKERHFSSSAAEQLFSGNSSLVASFSAGQ